MFLIILQYHRSVYYVKLKSASTKATSIYLSLDCLTPGTDYWVPLNLCCFFFFFRLNFCVSFNKLSHKIYKNIPAKLIMKIIGQKKIV